MAHHVEPMDIDDMDCDYDKENAYHHSNVLSRTPCTEKGYEELDVSELTMKLRYSLTPTGSPMSKSFTANCNDNRNNDFTDDFNNIVNNENSNLTRSLNSSLTKTDSIYKSKVPLQAISTEQFGDNNRNMPLLLPLDSTVNVGENNITVTVSSAHDIDENLSLPSSSSSTVHTPEATTPTKEIPKDSGGSPIMRGLKSVFNMFRSSQSPIPLAEDVISTEQMLSPTDITSLNETTQVIQQTVTASTPKAAHKSRDAHSSKRSSPHKDSIEFHDDLEKELQWKDETTIIFSKEKIPIHKLFLPQTKSTKKKNECILVEEDGENVNVNLDNTVEYMDISYNTTLVADKTMIEDDANRSEYIAAESDNEFLDCETTFTNNESQLPESDPQPVEDIKEQNLQNLNVTIDSVVYKDVADMEVPVAFHITKPSDAAPKIVAVEKLEKETDFKNDEIINIPSTASVIHQDEVNVTEIVNTAVPIITNTISKSKLDNNILIYQNAMQEDQVNINLTSENHQILSCSEANNITKANEVLHATSETELNSENVLNSDMHLNNKVNNSFVNKCDITLSRDSIDIDTTHHVNTNEATATVLNSHDVLIAAEVPLPGEDEKDLSLTYNVNWENTNVTKHSLSDIVSDIENYVQLENTLLYEQKFSESTVDSKVDANNIADNNTLFQITKSQGITSFKEEVKMTENVEFNSCQISDAQNLVATVLTSVELDNIDHNNVSNVQDLKPMDIIESRSNIQILPKDTQIQIDTEHNKIKVINISSMLKAEEVIGNTYKENSQPEITLQNVVEVKDCSENNTLAMDDVTNCSADVAMLNKKEIQENRNEVPDSLTNKDFSEKLALGEIEKNIQVTANNENENKDSNETCKVPISVTAVVTHLKKTEVNNTESNNQDLLSAHELLGKIHQLSNKDEATQNSINGTMDIVHKTVVDDGDKDKTENICTIIDTTIVQVENTESNVSENKIEELAINSNHVSEQIFPTSSNKDLANVAVSTEVIPTEENKLQEPVSGKEKQEEVLKIDDDVNNDSGVLTLNRSLTIVSSDHDKIIYTTLENDATAKNIIQNETLNVTTEVHVVENLNITNQLEVIKEPVQNTQENEVIVENIATVDEEIIISENNSPYVSVTEIGIVSDEKLLQNFEKILNPFVTQSKVTASPPISPKIVSKGQYNFNFDEIDDPFTTKTKIRVSPPPGVSSNQSFKLEDNNRISTKAKEKNELDKNRRKSQPTRKKTISNKKNFNRTFDATFANTDVQSDKANELQFTLSEDVKSNESQVETVELKGTECEIVSQSPSADKDATINVDNDVSMDISGYVNATKVCEEKCHDVVITVDNTTDDTNKEIEIKLDTIRADENKEEENIGNHENKSSIESMNALSYKTVSSLEQSTYYSANASSAEGVMPKNVFNLPEIDDMNFNPFASITNVCQSPLPTSAVEEDPFATKSKIANSPNSSLIVTKGYMTTNDVVTTEDFSVNNKENEDKEKSSNISDITVSSKTFDNKCMLGEVHTEDEDTIEGPFLEVEDLKDLDKMSDFDTEKSDIIHFNNIPAQENETGEMFIDAEAFDFLMSQNNCNEVVDSGKESLFLKFDPLFARRVTSDGVAAALSEIQKKLSTPKKMLLPPQRDLLSLEKPVETTRGSTKHDVIGTNNTVETNEDSSATVSKPMMAVPPAVNPIVTPRNKATTPTRTNRRSMTFTSPAMAVIDRLLSMSSNNSPVNHDSTMTQVRGRSEADLALTQLRELLAEKEVHVHHLRTESIELKDRLATLESQMRTLETESQTRLGNVNKLSERLTEKMKINRSMATVVEEYERTIASLISETEQDKKRHTEERMKLIKERDEQTTHLASMEVSFSDLHSKYEKSKQLILSYKANEDKYKDSIKEFNDNLVKMQNNYELLKQHATSKLNHANQELEKLTRSHEAEVLKLNAMIKRKDLHITSLEETLAQKTKANEELTAICDELINKVG